MMDLAARSDAVAHGRVMAETALGSGILNRPAALFVAIGLFLMAFFTLLWASWSFYHLSAVLGGAVMVIFGVFAAIYVINGVQLFRSASRLPLPVGEESQRRGRVLQRGFTITLSVRAWSSPSSACCLASRRLRVLRAGGRADRRPALHSVRLPLSPHDRLLQPRRQKSNLMTRRRAVGRLTSLNPAAANMRSVPTCSSWRITSLVVIG